jgi:hypothetical protein
MDVHVRPKSVDFMTYGLKSPVLVVVERGVDGVHVVLRWEHLEHRVVSGTPG